MTSLINADTSGGLKLTSDTSGALDIQSAGTTKIAMDSSGNVGIGTTASVNLLQISNASNQNDTYGNVQINYTGTDNANSGLTVKNYGGTSQFMQWENNGVRIGSRIITNSGVGAVIFTAGADSEKMRIAADGKVGIGLTSPTTTLHVKSPTDTGADVYAGTIENAKTDNGTATTGLRVKYTSLSPSDGNHIFQCLDSGGTVRFFVQNNGTRGGTSDRTLKENIVDATDKLAELRQLQVRNYNWIDHSPMGGFKELGFIAQEVEAIFPKMVRENPETGKKMLLDDVFVPILVKSLQEAADKIDALEARITALEAD
jgi:trimeric autotransporter adhesin